MTGKFLLLMFSEAMADLMCSFVGDLLCTVHEWTHHLQNNHENFSVSKGPGYVIFKLK